MTARYDPYKRAVYDQSRGIDAKIVVMGNTGVGKTSLLHRYVQNMFDPRNTTATTGAFFVTKKIEVNGTKVRLQLWDTAGQERFRSMAPMYYRGANAALILYDITNSSTFDSVRGWLEELKSSCDPSLLIYIVGSKADLRSQRQVTSDFARLSLQRWFPPPRAPTPPAPPAAQSSAFSYIRPRFTSLTSIRSAPLAPSAAAQPFPIAEFGQFADPPVQRASLQLQRSNTTTALGGGARPRTKSTSLLTRSNTTSGAAAPPLQSPPRYGSRFAPREAQAWNYNEQGDSSKSNSNSIDEEDEEGTRAAGVDGQEWGLSKDMELFEVSAKDDSGIPQLFETLISAIIDRKDSIERENELKKRDSVFLSSSPSWAAVADDEEEASEKKKQASSGYGCCST